MGLQSREPQRCIFIPSRSQVRGVAGCVQYRGTIQSVLEGGREGGLGHSYLFRPGKEPYIDFISIVVIKYPTKSKLGEKGAYNSD